MDESMQIMIFMSAPWDDAVCVLTHCRHIALIFGGRKALGE